MEKFQSDLEALRRDFVNAKARQEKMTLLSSGGGTKVRRDGLWAGSAGRQGWAVSMGGGL